MFTIKKLSECKLEEAVAAWNTGFQGYFFDATMDVDRFTTRLGLENLSTSLSIVAFDQQKPIGILLSGVKTVDGKKVAWNGGTGVATEYRRKGIGKLLIDKALEIYEEADVEVSTLEAITENTKAISLYEKKGYKIVDEVVHLRCEEMPEFYGALDYQAVFTSAQESQYLPIYKHDTPWQSQWFSMKEGQALQLVDIDGDTVAYGLFKREFDEDGTLKSVTVTHCYIQEGKGNPDYLIDSLFSYLFPPSSINYVCTVAFFATSNKRVHQFLLDKGFTKRVGQVWMKKAIKEGIQGGV
ncbi:GNAT family N-acetyltransferase [Bacillus tianshenii]|uniref:GNAT family N-acetyltransferase n=1 Tax=Sutcliffiella tianshenii TaxID=1463404 RepID=UPI001CD3AE03|nr:GNAT family N-acetyltransferase [Bacillus tianshenii]MCA1319087.1 GNAT family N-acetyltransferase [Bacillus tianshenii]